MGDSVVFNGRMSMAGDNFKRAVRLTLVSVEFGALSL